jgi:hypothetical protein
MGMLKSQTPCRRHRHLQQRRNGPKKELFASHGIVHSTKDEDEEK